MIYLCIVVVFVLDQLCSRWTSAHADGFCPAKVGRFDPRTDYRSDTRIHIRHDIVEKWEERPYVLQVKLVW